jgi:hypothetical protein
VSSHFFGSVEFVAFHKQVVVVNIKINYLCKFFNLATMQIYYQIVGIKTLMLASSVQELSYYPIPKIQVIKCIP